jgi:hypothetical protein
MESLVEIDGCAAFGGGGIPIREYSAHKGNILSIGGNILLN